MRLAETRVVHRDKRRDSDHEDLFHWPNLEEWKYYHQPDKPFIGTSREEFNKQIEERRRRPSLNSHGWSIDTTEGQHIGWVNYYYLYEQANEPTWAFACQKRKRGGKAMAQRPYAF